MNIGIVNDLPLAVEALRRTLALAPNHRVLWIARDGAEAVNACARETPDLVLMDLVMPGVDGVEATRRIMARSPCAILIVTASIGANSARVFEAMGFGALDAANTPVLGADGQPREASTLLQKIDTIGKLIGDRHRTGATGLYRLPSIGSDDALVAIGASAGGPAALATMLAGLPREFPAAVVVVQHVDEQFAKGMAEWLAEQSKLPVTVAKAGDQPLRGRVLLAGGRDHLQLEAPDRLGYTPEPIDYPYRPSVDVFFHSVCRWWLGQSVGVLLTGMGRDGARGLKAMRDKGCHTIAQDQLSSAVYGMPKAAATIGAAAEILPIERIAPRLSRLFTHGAITAEH